MSLPIWVTEHAEMLSNGVAEALKEIPTILQLYSNYTPTQNALLSLYSKRAIAHSIKHSWHVSKES
jgi:hypothetical protein